MAFTPSTMVELGTSAPDFSLPDTVSGKTLSLADFAVKKGLLMMFICEHCPFVIHIREGLSRLGRDYESKDIAIVAVSANDATGYPDDAPERLAEGAREHDYRFPYLHDASQEVAKAYRAACTPDFFLYDSERKLVYRGQFDASRPQSGIPVTGEDLRAAIDAVLAGSPVPRDQTQSIGCNIKWRKGNEPEYFGRQA